MKKFALLFLMMFWVLLNSFSFNAPVSFASGRVPINFTVSSPAGCVAVVSGTIDESGLPSTFSGTISFYGGWDCPHGTYTFTGRSSASVASGPSEYSLTFSHSSVCSSSTITWSENTGSDPDIAGFLNGYKTVMLEEIKEDAGCP